MSRAGRPCKNGPRAEWWRDYYAINRKRILAYQKRHRIEKRRKSQSSDIGESIIRDFS